MAAIAVPRIATAIAATASTRRLSRNPSKTRGHAATQLSGSKKLCCTTDQPGVLMIVSQTTTANTMVEIAAMSTERTDC